MNLSDAKAAARAAAQNSNSSQVIYKCQVIYKFHSYDETSHAFMSLRAWNNRSRHDLIYVTTVSSDDKDEKK